jgi:hypothetical protein
MTTTSIFLKTTDDDHDDGSSAQCFFLLFLFLPFVYRRKTERERDRGSREKMCLEDNPFS